MPVPNTHYDYQPWQVELLARRLLAYHDHIAILLPFGSWLAVAEQLIESPVTRLAYDENEPDLDLGDKPDKYYPIKGEALRRFARRLSMLPQSRALLDDLEVFLISVGFLSQWDLEPHAAPYHLTCALAQIFGVTCFADPAASTIRFQGDFLGRHEDAVGITETLVTMIQAVDGATVQVREICLAYLRRGPEPLAHLRARVERCEPCLVVVRDGIAMVTPKSGVIFGLCKDDETDGESMPGGVFLVQKIAYDQNRVQSCDLVGKHHLHDGGATSLRRIDGQATLDRMKRIIATVSGAERQRG